MFNPFRSYINKKAQSLLDLTVEYETANIFGLTTGQPEQMPPRKAYEEASRNNDLGDAVDRISGSIAELKKGTKEGEKGDIDFNSDIVKLLNNPGGGVSGTQFIKSASESYLLTEETWIVARGNISRPPLELVFMWAFDVSVVMDDSIGLPQTIRTMSSKDRRTYHRVPSGNGYRYIDKDNLNEIIPIIGDLSLSDGWRGRSPLPRLFYDIKMNTDGKRHNVSLLQNGMRTTGVISPKPTKEGNASWGDPAVKALQKRLRSFNQGAGNAGNTLIMGKPVDVQGMSQSNKDMDYISLLTSSQTSIYNHYKIPLALVLAATMTLDNYTQALRAYYPSAVFPVYELIADGIMRGLRERFGLSEETILTFSEVAIRQLQEVFIENMKSLKETEAVEVSEIRKVGGFEARENTDVILVSASKTPLESVTVAAAFPDVEPEEVVEVEIDEEEIEEGDD